MRNIVLHISRCVSLAVVFDFSSFLFWERSFSKNNDITIIRWFSYPSFSQTPVSNFCVISFWCYTLVHNSYHISSIYLEYALENPTWRRYQLQNEHFPFLNDLFYLLEKVLNQPEHYQLPAIKGNYSETIQWKKQHMLTRNFCQKKTHFTSLNVSVTNLKTFHPF